VSRWEVASRTARHAANVARILATASAVAACAGSEPAPKPLIEDRGPRKTNVEVNELEISAAAPDRFAHCPPPGELGQEWFPPIPPWQSSGSAVNVGDAGASVSFAVSPGAPDTVQPAPAQRVTHQELTTRAAESTRLPFRACYHKGLLYDPTQDGHVAIVLRIGPDGRVARVESYGACDLSAEVITCMMEAAKGLRFDAPAEGADTVTVPAVFHPQDLDRTQPLPSEPFAAAAYVVVEQARPALHACEATARSRHQQPFASATFTVELDAQGGVAHINVDPWKGNQDMLGCMAEVVNHLNFGPPPGGRGHVVLPIVVNPRPGTR
jgi:hypothetical protein